MKSFIYFLMVDVIVLLAFCKNEFEGILCNYFQRLR